MNEINLTNEEIFYILRAIENFLKHDTVGNVKFYKNLEELEKKLKNKLENALYGKEEK